MIDAVKPSTPDSDARNMGLDAIRVAAIVLVIFAHGLWFLQPGLVELGVSTATIVKMSQVSGAVGVELFFCLSGYLIGRILINLEDYRYSFDAIAVFLMRRWMRTLPLYYIVLLSLQCVPILDPNTRLQLGSYALLVQNLFSPMPSNWFGTSWSLTIEEWSYILLPLLAMVLQRFTQRSTIAAAIVLVVAGFALRLVFLGSDVAWDLGVRKFLPARVDAIAYGVLLAGWLNLRPERRKVSIDRLALIGLIAFATATYLLIDRAGLEGWYGRVLALPVLAMAICAIIPFVMTIQLPHVIAAPVRYVATISYSLYLLHWPVMFVSAGYVPQPLRFIFFVVVSGVVAAVFSHLIEQPVMRLRPKQWSGQARREFAPTALAA